MFLCPEHFSGWVCGQGSAGKCRDLGVPAEEGPSAAGTRAPRVTPLGSVELELAPRTSLVFPGFIAAAGGTLSKGGACF